jgi:protein-L-isoaspartate O-methyltransferase
MLSTRAASREVAVVEDRKLDAQSSLGNFAAELAAVSEAERDAWVERRLGIDRVPAGRASRERELIGYLPSGVGAILALIREVPIMARDHFVDIGSGLGKVTLLVRLLTGARVSGIERDAGLVKQARARAVELGVDGISYLHEDARAQCPEASIYYMYAPATGAALAAMLARLQAATHGRRAVVCTLGLDLPSCAWLVQRPSEELFTSIYDRVTAQ